MSRRRFSTVFALTPVRFLLMILLIFCWSVGHILPTYKPLVKARVQEARKMIPNIKLDWPTTDDPHNNFNTSKLALLIESRPLPHLVPQILHMISVVPPDWRFLFIGSRESVFTVSRPYAIKNHQVIGKLDLMELPNPWSIETKEDIFRMLTDRRFYDEFLPGVEWILKYEYDSLLCANSEISLDDWLGWDWAGSPRTEDDRFSGNGGLTLRRVSVIKRVLDFQSRFNDSEPEDEWFGKRLWVLPGARVASKLDGVLSVEGVYIEKPMGYHVQGGGSELNEQVWGDVAHRKDIFEYCPELSLIMDMKLERERCPDDDGGGHRKPSDMEATWSVLGEDGEMRETTEQAEVIIDPPHPPPLPQPWENIVSSAKNPTDIHLH
ncbi:hypothetical protein PT974_08204 [Cladobotryum mycophilum]|uniref:DUF5672 domain-containing protein n=1 Tax=Cladobotryum mycophilum TaxID=491253 RepID=A0ABR0SDM9_9HYPO